MSNVVALGEHVGTPYPHPVRVVSADLIRRTNPNPTAVERVPAHVVVVPRAGCGTHMVDFGQYHLRPGAAVHVQPGQVQRFDASAAFDGQVVIIDGNVPPSGLFRTGEHCPSVRLGDTAAIVDALLDDLLLEQGREQPSSQIMAAGAVLLLRHLARAGRNAPEEGLSSHATLLQSFRWEVEQSFAQTRNVSAYARSIGTSTKTLARATTGLTGLAPKEIIDRRVILEAKRLLAHSSDSIAGIGISLGFSEATNFTKFFVRMTGQTPHEFRS